MTFSPSKRKSLPRYSSLEDRRLLAGDVTVFENVNLYIRGDQFDNQFEVIAAGDNLEIKGLNGTTINGQESYVVTGTTVTESGVSFAGGLRAHLGPGNDDFAVKDAQFESMSLIYGGTGDDNVEVMDSRFMDRTTIQTFDGDDNVSTHGSHFEDTFFAITLDGQDSVSMIDSTMNGNSIVATGEHSDSIHSEGNHYMGDVNLILPLNGNDSVQLNNPVVGGEQLGVFLGEGDDTIDGNLNDAVVDGTIKIGGQAGVDRGDMAMDDDLESQVSVATIEATGELVYENVSGRTDLYGTDAFAKSAENGYLNFPATQLEFDRDTDIYSVSWAGSYEYSTPNENDRYVVTVYANEIEENIWEGEFDLPNTEEVVFEAVLTMDDLTRVATGETWSDQSPEREIFEFNADIELNLEGGQKYWFSIYQDLQVDQSDTAFAEYDNPFFWLAATGDTARKWSYYWSGDGFLTSGESDSGQIFTLRS